MKRSLHKGAFLIVEGDTDARLYKKFVDPQFCKVVVAHDKFNAINSMNLLEDDKFKGVLGVVDADFWRLEGIEPKSNNLFYTDTHDLETMILRSKALESVLVEFSNETTLNEFIKKRRRSLREILLEAGVTIGYLRWFALKENLYLRFNNLDMSKFINKKTLTLNKNKFFDEVRRHSKHAHVTIDKMSRGLSDLENKKFDPWQISVGHDLVDILYLGLKRNFGGYNTKSLGVGSLESSLRLAYNYAHFQDTQLFTHLREWEQKTGKRILRQIDT